VLHLGNLIFETVHMEAADDGSRVAPSCHATLKAASELIGLTAPGLEQALTVKSVGKFPVVQVP
jgi:hypothetical protein